MHCEWCGWNCHWLITYVTVMQGHISYKPNYLVCLVNCTKEKLLIEENQSHVSLGIHFKISLNILFEYGKHWGVCFSSLEIVYLTKVLDQVKNILTLPLDKVWFQALKNWLKIWIYNDILWEIMINGDTWSFFLKEKK